MPGNASSSSYRPAPPVVAPQSRSSTMPPGSVGLGPFRGSAGAVAAEPMRSQNISRANPTQPNSSTHQQYGSASSRGTVGTSAAAGSMQQRRRTPPPWQSAELAQDWGNSPRQYYPSTGSAPSHSTVTNLSSYGHVGTGVAAAHARQQRLGAQSVEPHIGSSVGRFPPQANPFGCQPTGDDEDRPRVAVNAVGGMSLDDSIGPYERTAPRSAQDRSALPFTQPQVGIITRQASGADLDRRTASSASRGAAGAMPQAPMSTHSDQTEAGPSTNQPTGNASSGLPPFLVVTPPPSGEHWPCPRPGCRWRGCDHPRLMRHLHEYGYRHRCLRTSDCRHVFLERDDLIQHEGDEHGRYRCNQVMRNTGNQCRYSTKNGWLAVQKHKGYALCSPTRGPRQPPPPPSPPGGGRIM